VRIGGQNTYAANTEINSGQLHVREGATVSAAGQTIYVGNGLTPGTSAGLFIADVDGGTSVAQGVRVNPGEGANRTIGGLNTSGVNTYSGGVDLSGSGDRSVTLQSTAGGTVRFSGAISGDGGVIVAGGGEVELEGANTYSGPTTVAGGTLRISNASGSGTGTGAVTVRGGARLAGGGSFSTAALLVEADGELAPDCLGTLTIDLGDGGQALFDEGAYFTFAITLGGFVDQVEFAGAGSVAFHDNVVNFIDLSGGQLAAGESYELFRFSAGTAVSGQLVLGTGLEAYAGSTLSLDDGVVRLHTVPEPATLGLLALGLAGLGGFRRRRR
jgi:autotransporter-associated beta strand protein